MEQDIGVRSVRDNSTLIAAAARQDPSIPIPSCPGWTMANLLVHLGSVHRGWERQVRSRSSERIAWDTSIYASVPGLLAWLGRDWDLPTNGQTLPPGTIEWFEEGARGLADALESIGPEEAVWSWSTDHTGRHYHRMMGIETAVHRWDAQSARGEPDPLDPDLATLGIEHMMEIMLPARRRGEFRAGTGERYHFHRTDGPGEWLVCFDGSEVHMAHEHAKGDIALRGSASDLLLWLWGRDTSTRLEVFGDQALLARFTELVPCM